MIGEVSRRSDGRVTEVESRMAGDLHAGKAGETVVVTRNGNPVAALIPLTGEGSSNPLEDSSPEKGLASLAGGWEDSDELADLVAESVSTRRGTSA